MKICHLPSAFRAEGGATKGKGGPLLKSRDPLQILDLYRDIHSVPLKSDRERWSPLRKREVDKDGKLRLVRKRYYRIAPLGAIEKVNGW